MLLPLLRADRYHGPGRTKVLLAVMTQPHPTLRSVAAEVGLSLWTVRCHVSALRRAGLIEGGTGKGSGGTLRPAVRPVLFGVSGT